MNANSKKYNKQLQKQAMRPIINAVPVCTKEKRGKKEEERRKSTQLLIV